MSEFIRIATRPFRKFVKRCYRNFRSRLYIYTAGTWLAKFLPLLKKDERPVVFSLVSNPAVSDARVLKEANSLRLSGYNVYIFCTLGKHKVNNTTIDGVKHRRRVFFRFDGKIDLGLQAYVLNLHGKVTSKLENILMKIVEIDEKIFIHSNRIRECNLRVKQVDNLRTKSDYANMLQKLEDGLRLLKVERAAAVKSNKHFLLCYNFAYNFLALKHSIIPDVIHAHDIYTLPAAIGLAKFTGARVVYDAHEIETERVPPLSSPAKKFIGELEKECLTQTDEMIVACESAADFYSTIFLKKRPVVIANAPQNAEFVKNVEDIRKRCRLTVDTKLIVYVGIVGREGRGLDLVLRALSLMPLVHLAVLGPRHESNDEWLLNTAINNSVADRLHLLSPVQHELVSQVIATADVGICAIQDLSLSYRYALPNKLFEMVFAGLPVCVSNLPEMKSFVEKNHVGVTMNQTEPREIANAIQEILLNPTKYRRTSAELDIIKSEYGWEAQSKKLANMYSQMLTSNV